MKILVTGGNGQLGREISQLYEQNHELIVTDRNSFDVTDYRQAAEIFSQVKPEAVIHCAAYTNVDGAESDADGAFRGNVIATQNVAAQALKYRAKLVYVSTDYVFDGCGKTPYREFDQTNPLNVYGKTKLYGENMVKEIIGSHFIVRTSWLYGDGNNFVKTMLKLATQQNTLRVVNDQFGTPTYVKDLALTIEKLILSDAYGTYHATGKGACSWYDFAREIFSQSGKSVSVESVSTGEFPRQAKRPAYSVLENYMLAMTVGDSMRPWQEALQEYLQKSPTKNPR